MRSQFLNAWKAIITGNPANFNKKYGVVIKKRKTRRLAVSRKSSRKTRRLMRR